MALQIYDTATRSTRAFVPLVPGEVRMYLCGATVQGAPHVGHIRAGLVFDVLSRWLRSNGLDVVLCRNVTDIDDKILDRAVEEGRPWWAVAAHYEREFTWAYEVLGCEPPTVEPRATGHITQMVTLISRLIDAGHAYTVGGDVYFDVRSWPEYGALSGQRVDELQPAADSQGATDKKDPRDFALWKSAKPGEPSWPTPWGEGRPGWHIECSAMSTTYLGQHFDIHGGGLDLVFPHHENEMAQSRAAGDGFAAYWVHNSWVTMAGEKMSKSLGNTLRVREVLRRARPIELRWYLVSAHYRSMLEFSDESLAESAAAFRRIEGFIHRAVRAADVAGVDLQQSDRVPDAFAVAMDDDLNTPAAVAVIHESVHAGNAALDSRDTTTAVARAAEVLAMLDVLGLSPLAENWSSTDAGDSALRPALDALLQPKLAARQVARAERDFATADALRDELRAAGIEVEDSADGPVWSLTEERES